MIETKKLKQLQTLLDLYFLEIRKIDTSDSDGVLKSRLNQILLNLLCPYKSELPPLGDEFMRTFRKTDVITAPGVDSAIYHLLECPQTDLFFYCMKAVTEGASSPLRPYTVICVDKADGSAPLLYLVELTDHQVRDSDQVKSVVAKARQDDLGGEIEEHLENLTIHMLFENDLTPAHDFR